MLTHVPFRPWCKHCVSGRAPDDPHSREVEENENEVPTISVDYCFLRVEEGDGVSRTALVLHAKPNRLVAATCVQGKGREDPEAVTWLIAQLRRLGLGRCVLQADGEPAQRGFVKDVIEAAVVVTNLGVAGAQSLVHDHKANGAVERVIREVKGLVRSL